MCSQKCARPEIFAGSDNEPVNLRKTATEIQPIKLYLFVHLRSDEKLLFAKLVGQSGEEREMRKKSHISNGTTVTIFTNAENYTVKLLLQQSFYLTH